MVALNFLIHLYLMGTMKSEDNDEQIMYTQNDGRKNDDEENLPTQTVAPLELQAVLRFKPVDSATDMTQREERLTLPIEVNSELLVNLGRLNSSELNSAKYHQLIRLYDPTRPPDKQIISREHSQLLIRQIAPGCSWCLSKIPRTTTVIGLSFQALRENLVW